MSSEGRELLKGTAKFEIHRNDMYWDCMIMDSAWTGEEFFTGFFIANGQATMMRIGGTTWQRKTEPLR